MVIYGQERDAGKKKARATLNQQLLHHHIKEFKFAYRNGLKDKMIHELNELIYFSKQVKREIESEVEE